MDKDISLSIEKHIEWVKSMGKGGKRIYLDGMALCRGEIMAEKSLNEKNAISKYHCYIRSA